MFTCAGLTIDRIDLVELNEAFAAQAIACMRELTLDPAKVNIYGGAIALGHPLRATGARMLTTLVHALHRTKSRDGFCMNVNRGGQGVAHWGGRGGRDAATGGALVMRGGWGHPNLKPP